MGDMVIGGNPCEECKFNKESCRKYKPQCLFRDDKKQQIVMKQEKDIEIPFGAFDSELGGWQYTIPEGCEAVVENGKVIVRKSESEDEKTKKEIINYLECQSRDEPSHNKWISYIEKYALSKDNYGFLRDCARVLKTFGWQSYADRLTGLCPASGEAAKAMMSTPIIFDESKDERIRQGLICFLTNLLDQGGMMADGWDCKECEEYIVWLEKQGEQKPVPDWMPKFLDELRSKKNYFDWDEDKDIEGGILAIINWMNPNYFNEKDGEQKPADKVEPKFKVGDWVVFNEHHNSVYQVERIDNYRYYLRHYLGGTLSVHFDNELIRHWTIEDARDGDVLSYRDGQWIFIYKGFGKEENEIAYYALLSDEGLTLNNYNYSVLESAFSPATKEERDTLEKAMSDAGYTFNFEKKELRKIGQKPAMIQWKGDNLKEVVDFTGVYKEGFEKWFHNSWEEYEKYVHEHNNIFKIFNEDGSHMEIPVGAWIIKAPDGYNTASRFAISPILTEISIESNFKFKKAIECIENYVNSFPHSQRPEIWQHINFLKSLKERVQSQPKQEWSEEDKDMWEAIEACCKLNRPLQPEHFNWLKSLRPQKQQEWNKQDIEMIDWLIRCCEKEHEELCNDRYGHQDIVSDLKRDCRKKWDWLESLKNKVVPQNTWKPSEEQIEALESATANCAYSEYQDCLKELIEQLKKL